MDISRQNSIKLLDKYIANNNLKNHCRMVATAMEAYAKHLDKSDDEILTWWTAGLLHDLDWEKYPDEHPNKAINDILPALGYSQEILDAISAHAPDRTQKHPETEVEKYLFACDELSGFMNAVSIMRPTKFDGMKVRSITKRLKQNNFAAGVSREDVYQGAELIEKDLREHIQFLIDTFNN